MRYKYSVVVMIKGGGHLVEANNILSFLCKLAKTKFINDMRHYSITSPIFPKKNCSCLFCKLPKLNG